MPSCWNIRADILGHSYIFHQNITTRDKQTSTTIHLMELAIPFETAIEETMARKQTRYASLKEARRASGHIAMILSIAVSFRDYLQGAGVKQLYSLMKASATEINALEMEVIKYAVVGSYHIWCKQNWKKKQRPKF